MRRYGEKKSRIEDFESQHMEEIKARNKPVDYTADRSNFLIDPPGNADTDELSKLTAKKLKKLEKKAEKAEKEEENHNASII